MFQTPPATQIFWEEKFKLKGRLSVNAIRILFFLFSALSENLCNVQVWNKDVIDKWFTNCTEFKESSTLHLQIDAIKNRTVSCNVNLEHKLFGGSRTTIITFNHAFHRIKRSFRTPKWSENLTGISNSIVFLLLLICDSKHFRKHCQREIMLGVVVQLKHLEQQKLLVSKCGLKNEQEDQVMIHIVLFDVQRQDLYR